MGQAACRPACERRKRTRSSDQAQGAKAYGGREATATRIPHHKPTKPERKQNKTKQTKGEPRLGPPVRPSAARPDSQPHPHPLLVCAPSSRQPDNQPRPQHLRADALRPPRSVTWTRALPGTSWSLDCDRYSSPAAAVPTRPHTRIADAGQNTAVGVGSRRGLFSPPVRRPHVVGSDRSDQPRGACMMSLRPRARASVSCHGPLSRTAQNKNSVAQG